MSLGRFQNCNEFFARWQMLRSADTTKDQTYFLFGLTQPQLARTLFPLGGMMKPQVRELAAGLGLPVAEKPDSQEICFVPNGDYGTFIEAYSKEQGINRPRTAGQVVTPDGEVLGEHDGVHHCTVGQRKGIEVKRQKSEPLYVIETNPVTRRVVVGSNADFFFGDDLESLSPDDASFRSMSKMKASQRDMALSQGTIALHLNKWLEGRFILPAPDLPDLSRERSPDAAAATLRKIWSIGQLSIRNMVHLLEAKGVRVFSLSIEAKEVDAFSMWKGSTPFVFLNSFKSSEHNRYDAAHELGHLVLHRHGSPNGQDAEREANSFAASFLMPEGDVLARCPSFVSLETIVSLKRRWTVSVAALARRLHDLKLLTDWQYRGIAIQMAKRGYRTSEPDGAPRERSQVLQVLFAALYKEDGISRSSIASDLAITTRELGGSVIACFTSRPREVAATGMPRFCGPEVPGHSPERTREWYNRTNGVRT